VYAFLIFIHVLALVYWLGGDLGTYLSSKYVLDEKLSVESRQTAFGILLACDMGPKLAMPIILGAGLHLTHILWGEAVTAGMVAVGWIIVAVWLSLIFAQHTSLATSWPQLAKLDLTLRYGVIVAMLFLVVLCYQSGLPNWLLAKMFVYLSLVACGIAVRYALKPFALAYGRMLNEGASSEINEALRFHMGVCRRYVWAIWVGLFLNTALGVKFLMF
jgi:hypothetical protein